MIHRRVIVHGLVQGVFFRDTVCRQATARHVSGWARNEWDGSVQLVFEGEPGAVEALVEVCRTGPRGSRVDRIEIFDEEPEGLSGFSIS